METRLTRPSEVHRHLRTLKLTPSKTLGQNFLIDANVAGIIISAADLSESDHVLEVGPGLGALTERMLPLCGGLTAVEMDKRLAEHLKNSMGMLLSFTLLVGDALSFDMTALLQKHGITKVVSNLPYSSGTRILVEILRADCRPVRMVLTMQLDVIERLIAVPGTASYGLLSIWSQRLYRSALLKKISANCFYPRPRVTSAVIVMDRKNDAPTTLNEPFFYDLTRHTFQQRRKKLANSLLDWDRLCLDAAAVRHCFRELAIDEGSRPENLSPEKWEALSNMIYREGRKI